MRRCASLTGPAAASRPRGSTLLLVLTTFAIMTAGLPAASAVAAAAAAPEAVCAPLACAQVKVTAPYVLTFDQDHGGLSDKDGTGTGFTWVDKPTAGGTGYLPANLDVDTAAGTLNMTTTSGVAYLENNNQDNTLGVGIDAANQISVLETRLVNLPPMTGLLEQAGLWYGRDDDNYLKLVVISLPEGTRVQFVEERNGLEQQQVVSDVFVATGATAQFQLRADPLRQTVTAYYGVNGAPLQLFKVFRAPTRLFNGPGTAVDPAVGTGVFGGVFATDRLAPSAKVFQFDYFSLTSAGPVRIQYTYLPFVVKP